MQQLTIERVLSRIAEVRIEPLGYVQVDALTFERSLDGVTHGLSFVKGRQNRAGRFAADVYMRFTHSPIDTRGSMTCHLRIGENEWHVISSDSVENIVNQFSNNFIPILTGLETIASIVECYEVKRYDASFLFGRDRGWQLFNLGFCYLWLGRYDLAKQQLSELVDEHSKQPFAWVMNRKQVAIDALLSLS